MAAQRKKRRFVGHNCSKDGIPDCAARIEEADCEGKAHSGGTADHPDDLFRRHARAYQGRLSRHLLTSQI